jgi:hypothetical protein
VQLQSQPDLAARARGRRQLLLIAGLFFVPLAISFAMYYGNLWRPAESSNHGVLITPAVPLAHAPLASVVAGGAEPAGPEPRGAASSGDLLRGKWSLVYVGDGACDAACREALVFGRQVRLTLNNEMSRVQRVFLASANCCDNAYFGAEHPGMIVADAAASAALLAQFPTAERAESLFIVDPLGNLMMRYDTRASAKGLQSDLKKLLKLSHIG